MTNQTFMRSTLALILAGALFGLVPAAAGQTLLPIEGVPVPYQVSLPVGWESVQEDDMLFVSDENVVVLVAAQDLLEDEGEPLPVSDAEARRMFTDMIVGSDSMLMAMITEGFAASAEMDASDAVQEIRTLGGQRAAYLRGRYKADGESGWMDVHVTVKDGIMYMLAFMVQGDDIAPHDPLFARIHESFVLADAPQ